MFDEWEMSDKDFGQMTCKKKKKNQSQLLITPVFTKQEAFYSFLLYDPGQSLALEVSSGKILSFFQAEDHLLGHISVMGRGMIS